MTLAGHRFAACIGIAGHVPFDDRARLDKGGAVTDPDACEPGFFGSIGPGPARPSPVAPVLHLPCRADG